MNGFAIVPPPRERYGQAATGDQQFLRASGIFDRGVSNCIRSETVVRCNVMVVEGVRDDMSEW